MSADDEREDGAEEGEEEEKEEVGPFANTEWEYAAEDAIRALDDGPKTYIVGGFSSQTSVQGALNKMAEDHERLENWSKMLKQWIDGDLDTECTLRNGGKDWPALADQKLILVMPGEYNERVSLTNNEKNGGVYLIGDGDASAIVISQGLEVGVCDGIVAGMTFGAPAGGSALTVRCASEGTGVHVEITNCHFRGGRNIAEFHPWVEPLITACNFTGAEEGDASGTKVGLYCHAQSRPTLRSGIVANQATQFRKIKNGQKEAPASKDGPKCPTVAAGDAMWLDKHEDGGDGTKWSKVRWRGVDGWVQKRPLRYEALRACAVTGTKKPGTVGVYVDDALCNLHGLHVTGHETGCYMKEVCREAGNNHKSWNGCAHALLDGCVMEDISGNGLYLADGCRAAVQDCRVRNCQHYALLVASSAQPEGNIPLMCAELEAALLRGDGLVETKEPRKWKSCEKPCTFAELKTQAEQSGFTMAERFYAGDRFSTAKRTWKSKSGESGTWAPPETRPLLRGNVLVGSVKIQTDAFPTFIDNCVVGKGKVAKMDAVLAVSSSPTGIKAVSEEPKMKAKKRDEEEEEEG